MRAAWLLECFELEVVTDKTTLACDLRPEDGVEDDDVEDVLRRAGGEDGWWEDEDPP